MRRLAVVGGVLAALVVGACGGKDEPLGPVGSVPQATTTTNPYAIPPVIDEAYVNRVLAGLDQAYGEITRLIVGTRTLTPEVVRRLNGLYLGDQVQVQIDIFQGELRADLRMYKPNPNNQISTITAILSAKLTCIFAEIHRDLTPVLLSTDPELERQWVALVPVKDGAKSASNPTPWVYFLEGFAEGFTQPEDPCGTMP